MIEQESSDLLRISGNRFEVIIRDVNNFSDKDRLKLEKAVQLWEDVWNDPAFQQKILEYRLPMGFWMSGGLNNEQVLAKMLAGAERLENEADSEADIFLTLAKGSKNVLGWTNPHTKIQWISRWFFRSATPEKIAGNLAHEYCHKLGFKHEYKNTKQRKYSVPYAVGYLTAIAARKLRELS
jgi:hypothetical protein